MRRDGHFQSNSSVSWLILFATSRSLLSATQLNELTDLLLTSFMILSSYHPRQSAQSDEMPW